MLLRPALQWISIALVTLGGLNSCVRSEKLDERIAKAYCDYAVECGEFKNVRTCMELTYVEQPETYLDAAIDAGRLDYDSAQAYRCVRAIKKLKCHRGEDQSEVAEDCQGILSGAVEPDQPCRIADECVGELSVCGFDPTCTDECCPGECRFIPGPFAAGEPCDEGQQCEAGTYCKFNVEGEEFTAVCTALPGEGDSCEVINYGNGDTCTDGTFCNSDEVCEKPRKDGESCSDNDQCQAKSRCDDEICVARVRRGKPCDSDSDCLHGDSVCHDDECTRRLGVGEECGGWTPPCVGYAVCTGAVCTELGKVGDPCDPLDPLGETGVPCYPSLYCDEGACTKPEAPEAMEFCPVPE